MKKRLLGRECIFGVRFFFGLGGVIPEALGIIRRNAKIVEGCEWEVGIKGQGDSHQKFI